MRASAAVADDVLIIGSGFGGAVSALRLVEKGYRVRVLEAGRRFDDADHARTTRIGRFLFAPRWGLMGIQRIHLLPHVVVLAGAGVGGGSLNYANTLYVPQADAFYCDPQWAQITDWRSELAPYYQVASRMLGVVTNPTLTPADRLFRELARDVGREHTFRSTPVGVFFGREGRCEPGRSVPDPFFGGIGPVRTGCVECGDCMAGCRYGAKNTLVKNYLHLAQQAGAVVEERRTVVDVRPRPGGGYDVVTRQTGPWWTRRERRTYQAGQVVVAAGAWGTQLLLSRLKAEGALHGLSPRLGHVTRTNSEALCGASTGARKAPADFSRGVAITSSYHPDEITHLEPCRYGAGSNLMGLLTAPMTDGGRGRWGRLAGVGWEVVRHPGRMVSMLVGLPHWSERGVIALVMQSRDNSLVVSGRRRWWRGWHLMSQHSGGDRTPSWVPVGNEAMRRVAQRIGGFPLSSLGEVVDIPMTAHFLGGCVIGATPQDGVVDPYHRVFGYPGLHIVDGSTVSANPGVNPSLTITAQAERAMALWPNYGERDPRPSLGAAYVRLDAVPPRSPVLPGWLPAGGADRAPE
ncbi:Cholesterol oxidase [Austwickia sp. TVS 96-490-7B]|uniref:FAD-dependent oxidoreductase n=1 Tax=Austwickia sp. TVS 96-490-7B TaxID=2830843 RepID=UPI001C59B9D8|nr:GMC family oxidoreductase [Austwickia sp. TVS 96-490-7B]MBW3086689.1 Cholesterol oxidase [Austwickia sp. TVS 96-490-7B]